MGVHNNVLIGGKSKNHPSLFPKFWRLLIPAEQKPVPFFFVFDENASYPVFAFPHMPFGAPFSAQSLHNSIIWRLVVVGCWFYQAAGGGFRGRYQHTVYLNLQDTPRGLPRGDSLTILPGSALCRGGSVLLLKNIIMHMYRPPPHTSVEFSKNVYEVQPITSTK